MEFLDNCKNANGNQSLWNVKLLKTNTMKADESPVVIALLISIMRIQRELCDNAFMHTKNVLPRR